MTAANTILFFFIILNLILILNFSKISLFQINIDKPDNQRKTHIKPTPLAGGTIILINILIYCVICNFNNELVFDYFFFKNIKSLNIFVFFSTIIFLLGFFDDRFNLKANLKIFILLFLTIILLLIDQDLIINKIEFSFYKNNFFLNNYNIFFSIFCFLVFLNAYNMFDGINLQSSMYSILIFICIYLIYSDLFFIKLLIISLIGFSYLNYKNKSFLGDSGTLLLGFVISYIFIKLYNYEFINYADEIVIFMIIPGIDLIRLFITRILNKKNPLSPDRQHLHHLLIEKISLNKSLLIIFCLLIFPIILNLININNLLTFFLTILAYLSLFFFISSKS